MVATGLASALVAALAVAPPLTPSVNTPAPDPSLSSVTRFADYEGRPAARAADRLWVGEQEPRNSGKTQTERIRLTPSGTLPGAGGWKPGGGALRVELRPFESRPGARDGDVTVTSSYSANRAEVYGRTPASGLLRTPAPAWPDPVGSTRYYSFAVLVPESFVTVTDPRWEVLTQWKGLRGGSPPLTLEVKRDGFRLGGSRTNRGLVPGDGALGPLAKGTWTRFTFGVHWSPRADQGWVEVYRDGQRVLTRTPLATMDATNPYDARTVDPVYLKQGIYRDTSWTVTHVVWFGPVTVSNRLTGAMVTPSGG